MGAKMSQSVNVKINVLEWHGIDIQRYGNGPEWMSKCPEVDQNGCQTVRARNIASANTMLVRFRSAAKLAADRNVRAS